MLKPKSVYKYFVQDFVKNVPFSFPSLKMLENTNNKYYPPATFGMIFSPKFVLDAKIQRSWFWKYNKYSVALNINFKIKLIF